MKWWKDKTYGNGWEVVKSDEAFQALFKDAHIIQATADGPNGVYGDVYWELSDGSWLAMEVEVVSGCPTCGPEREKHFWHRPPQSQWRIG